MSQRWPVSICSQTKYMSWRAASIWVAISAILKRIAWKSAIGRPNCRRSLAYAIESSSAPWARPMARAAVWARAVSRPEVA